MTTTNAANADGAPTAADPAGPFLCKVPEECGLPRSPFSLELELKVYRNVLELVLFNLEHSVVSFLIYSMAGVPALLEIYSIVEKGPGAESNWTLNHIKWKLMVGGDTSNERKNCGAARKKGKVTEIKN